jgi:hypothetical protein
VVCTEHGEDKELAWSLLEAGRIGGMAGVAFGKGRRLNVKAKRSLAGPGGRCRLLLKAAFVRLGELLFR